MSKNIYTVQDLVVLFEKKPYLLSQGTKKTAKRMKISPELVADAKRIYREKYKVKIQTNEYTLKNFKESQTGLVSSSGSEGTKQEVYKVKEKITTLDEFIKIFKPDLSKWKIKKWSQNYWAGFSQVKVEYEAISISESEYYKEFLKELKEAGKTAIKIETPTTSKNSKKHLLELVLPDLHLAKMTHEEETGEHYDTEEAIYRYQKAVSTLLSRVPLDQIGKVLLVVGNDLGNFDNLGGATTAGTPQDSDSRYHKMFIKAKKLMINTINTLLKHCPVDVEVVSGNHDNLFAFHVGEVLDAYFDCNKDVTVNNSPKPRKYYKFGKCLIGLAHGDNEKEVELPLIMAREAPQLWADTKYREWHLGHFHKTKSINFKSIDENQGIRVRRLPALTATDAWHNRKAYHSLKSADAFVWSKEEGMILQASYNL